MRNNKLFWVLAILTVLLFGGSWAIIYNSFYGDGSGKWLYPAIVLFLASASFYLLIIVTKKSRILFLVSVIFTLPAIVLGREVWYSMLITWGISILFYMLAIKRIKIEQYNRIKINIYRTLKRGVPIIGTGLSFLIASGFYFSIINQQKIGEVPRFEVEISGKMTNGMLNTANIILPTKELSWVLEGITVDEYILRMLKAQAGAGGIIPEQFVQTAEGELELNEAQLQEILLKQQEKIVEANREQLAKQLKTEMTGEERMDQVINGVANKRINEILNGDLLSANVVPIGVAFGMFITVRSLVWIFNGILFLLVTGVFSVLVKTKAVIIRKETREVEEIL